MVKNVIIVCDYGYIEGGAARIAHETALALQNKGLRVIFFCAVGPVSEELQASGMEIVCLDQSDILHERNRIKGVMRGINNKFAKKKFATVLNSLNPDETVIHVHTWTKAVSSSIFKVARKKKFKVVITVHDYFLICPNGGLFNYKKREICQINPMSAKCLTCNCDARSYPQKLFRVLRQRKQNKNIFKGNNVSYIFISEFSKREFFKRYNKIPEDKLFFLPNMINFDETRFRVECENNDLYLFIGGVTEVKGIRTFCEAVTKAGVKAVVIGQGMLKEELEKSYPDIKFVGWKTKEEMLPYIKQTRCLIFPSIWYEAMPLTPLEVMVYGIPVICSSLNAASEYVPVELHYDGTAEDLAHKIEESKSNEFIEKNSKAIFFELNIDRFSESIYLKNLIDIYNSIVQN